LISRILVLKLIQVILTPPYNVIGIIGSISWISSHAIVATNTTDKIGGGIWAISLVLRHVVSSLVGRIHVLPIMWVVLGLLLSIDESHPVDVVILMMIVLVSPHYQLLLCPLESDWSYRLCSITRDIDVSHILIVSMPLSEIVVGHHLRQHLLLDIWWVIQVHVLLPILFMNWGLSFHGLVMLICNVGVWRIFPQLLGLIVVIIVVVILQVFLRSDVAQ